MKRFVKVLAVVLLVVLIVALAACQTDNTTKRLTAVKANYEQAGYTVASINKSNDLVKDKETHIADAEEIYSITKAATAGNTGESYILYKFKDVSKAEALKTAYGNSPKTAHCERLLLVGLNGTNVKPFEDAYKD